MDDKNFAMLQSLLLVKLDRSPVFTFATWEEGEGRARRAERGEGQGEREDDRKGGSAGERRGGRGHLPIYRVFIGYL